MEDQLIKAEVGLNKKKKKKKIISVQNVNTVYSGYSGHVSSGRFGYSGHFSWYKIHLFYYIQIGYSGQSDIVARKWWPKMATISEVYCNI